MIESHVGNRRLHTRRDPSDGRKGSWSVGKNAGVECAGASDLDASGQMEGVVGPGVDKNTVALECCSDGIINLRIWVTGTDVKITSKRDRGKRCKDGDSLAFGVYLHPFNS